MTSKFYYNYNNTTNKSDNLGEDAAKIASDASQYTTPNNTFTIHNYYVDADTSTNTKANYEYIAPSTSDYGGWASYDYHAIAKDKFYYDKSSSGAYESFRFVHKLSAPLLKQMIRETNWDRCQAPFKYYAMGGADYAGYAAKIYWDNSNNRIQVDILDDVGGILPVTDYWQGYGVFILLSGAGGGGGGGDNEYWGQGKPGGGGGGGGGTALIYFDAKSAYDHYSGSYLYISIGAGGAGGKGGNGFAAGSAGGDSEAKLKNSSGTTMCSIVCSGGKGGAGHPWNAAANALGGAGGTVNNYLNGGGQYNNTLQFLKLLDSAAGGAGGDGKRGSDGQSGASVAGGNWNIPFNYSWGTWGKRNVFSYNSTSCSVGQGGSHNWQGGGGGGCSAGYRISTDLVALKGQGVGGYGGGSNQAGAKGENGFCGIFYNNIPGVTYNCIAKKY